MSKNEEVAIRVSNVSKAFKLPHEKQSSIKGLFVSMFKGKRTFERQQVLEDISFEIKKGEFFGIVGRNGSGKSTLLKMLAGIYSPDKGHIQVNGKLTPFIELGVGFNPELTGRENVFLNGALLGFNRIEIASMYDEIVAFAEIENFMDQKLKNYSSGMQVRLAFSIAIRANTDILVLDEVLAVGDANFQKKCFDYFRQLKIDKKTVILVSHDMDSVRRFSDRALLLEKSRIILIDEPQKVSEEYMRRNDPGMTVETRKAKKSTKKINIDSVKLLDAQNKRIYELDGNAGLYVQIQFSVLEKQDKLNFGVGMWSDSGMYVLSYNTQMDAQNIDVYTKTVTLNLKELPLLNGAYYVNVVCFGEDELSPYDFKEHAAKFVVYNAGKTSQYRGIMNVAHEWDI